MKIAILTLPFRTNYGQILQGYALQTVLSRMGHEVEMLDDPYFSWDYYLRYPLMCVKRTFEKFISGKKDVEIFVPEHVRIRQHTQDFIDKHIHRRVVRRWDSRLASEFDAFVVGSDQVWRPKYFISGNRPDMGIAFLSFASGKDVKRISYAASFGTDECEYTEDQLVECRQLLKKFDAISVREQSGVTICKEHFETNATHVLDPTLLLSAEDYMSLIPKDCPKSEGDMLVYVLDENEQVRNYIDRISQKNGLAPFRVNAKKHEAGVPLTDCIQPSVEKWLQGFKDARLVVTDSFHACVFSIIFHKPFICIGNKDRGMSRFDSLLRTFNLDHRFKEQSDDFYNDMASFDWTEVDEILGRKRDESMLFLHNGVTCKK